MAPLRRLRVAALALLAACSASVERPPKPPPGDARPERTELPGPSPATCDPSGCPLLCLRIGGCEHGASCLADCQARCGDGYFDDRDGPLMACVLGATGDSCAALRRCCEADFTSQLCALEFPSAAGEASDFGASRGIDSPSAARETGDH